MRSDLTKAARKCRICAALAFIAGIVLLAASSLASAEDSLRRTPLVLGPGDVIPTGNEWIALPEINAADGSLSSFNALSMRDRGLLQVTGERGGPVLKPVFSVDGKPVEEIALSWELIEYWIPTAHFSANGLEGTITYCAPPGSRAAFLKLTLTNRRAQAATVGFNLNASWGALDRVTYTPVELRGERTVVPAPWTTFGQVFAFITHDTQFAWSLYYPGSTITNFGSPVTVSPGLRATHEAVLAPGETAEVHYVIGIGMEEYSGAESAQALEDGIDRHGTDYMIGQAAAWCRKHTRSTGQADLDLCMNRNYLFTALYAWGRTLDTEQLAGVTSRSPRYYVSAAYWDRDAMLWSFPGLLDIDAKLAREALQYALTVQLPNVGTHSRFIGGTVLEDGYELDEGVAPLIALSTYIAQTNDDPFLEAHRGTLTMLIERLQEHYDKDLGLYSTLQDAQDQYRKQEFSTYDNALVWKALAGAQVLFRRLHDPVSEKDMQLRASDLRAAILRVCVSPPATGAAAILVSATDGQHAIFADVPPGSLMKLPVLGLMSEDDPLFVQTYAWLHSSNYQYSFADQPYGLPGSYRLPFTTAWSVADHLQLKRGRERALKILRESSMDAGIVSEGLDARTGLVDHDGRAFATAAGYVAHAICESFCIDSNPAK
jgi:hypothetical protein